MELSRKEPVANGHAEEIDREPTDDSLTHENPVDRARLPSTMRQKAYIFDGHGSFALNKQMLDDRRFPKMHLNLQQLLQVIAHGEQVLPRVKEKCSTKGWFASKDINSSEELIGRLRTLKENVGFIANRVMVIQAGLDSWQSEQINRKLYYLSFLSIVFLPLSIITGVFGMNVGGVPWTGQDEPELKDGFHNRTRVSMKRSWSINRKPFLKRTIGLQESKGYLRI
ncbi:unnamed protein product [Linum trigynum]|uniref:Uncharacterized protein n=1 Tax=Linum trigynum TaxID=586398 RepID=A0AAV2EWW1_9ROSI